jgi:hypothetical protein
LAGAGFGSTFSGTLRALLPTAEPHSGSYSDALDRVENSTFAS